MRKLIILLFLCLALYLLLKMKEPFQSYSQNELLQIIDKSDLLPNFEDNSIAEIYNIKQYKLQEFDNKVSKMLKFENSALRLKNLNLLKEYTLQFYVEFNNQTSQQVIVNGVDINNNIIYQLYTFNNYLYIKFYNKTEKFVEQIIPNISHPIVLTFSANQLTCYYNYDTKTLNSEDTRETNNDIIFGSIYKNKTTLNPFNGFIGNIMLFKELHSAEELLKFGNIGETRVVERNNQSCKFIPNGNSIYECKEKCKTDSNCSADYCSSICNSCIDYNNCKWVQPEANMEQIIIPPKADKPNAPRIKCLAGDGFIEIRFKKPNDNNNPIGSYLVQSKKSYSNDGFLKLTKFDSVDCGRNSCKYRIPGLENQEYYNISVRAINSIGMSPSSNVEVIAPIGEKSNPQISDALVETDDEIKKEVLKSFNYDNSDCNSKNFVSYDEHILDKIDVRSIDDFIKDQYVKK